MPVQCSPCLEHAVSPPSWRAQSRRRIPSLSSAKRIWANRLEPKSAKIWRPPTAIEAQNIIFILKLADRPAVLCPGLKSRDRWACQMAQ